ncbi:MAG: mandelate racemase/muconate lactonizing enzyme family protein [Euryarchaeota archaeon]|nr:mandelate racemase/muconate lactonizing enzyme family protein [Euryarchaeota archaeon]
MRIKRVSVDTFRIPIPKPGFRAAWRAGLPEQASEGWVVRIATEAHEGFGVGLSLSGGEPALMQRYLVPLLTGVEPTVAVGRIAELLRFVAFLGNRLWPVELALWDLIAREAGKPLARLVGVKQEKVRVYLSTGEVKPPAQRLPEVQRWMEEGFQAVKLRAHSPRWEEDLETVRQVCDLVGDRMGVMVDANQAWNVPLGPVVRWTYTDALKFARGCEKLGVLWLEEPLDRDDWEGLARLRGEMETLKIAGAELDTGGIAKFNLYLERGIYDVIQPDLCLSSGWSQGLKIAALAEAHGVWCTPHTWTTGYGLAASLQMAACLEHAPWLEYPLDPPGWPLEVRDALLREPIRPDKKGYLRLPDRPGMGVELNTEALEKYRTPE